MGICPSLPDSSDGPIDRARSAWPGPVGLTGPIDRLYMYHIFFDVVKNQ